jgi:hypothetical protein
MSSGTFSPFKKLELNKIPEPGIKPHLVTSKSLLWSQLGLTTVLIFSLYLIAKSKSL